MQIGAVRVVAPDVLDERRAVLGGAVTAANVAIVEVEAVKRQNAAKRVQRMVKGYIRRYSGRRGAANGRILSGTPVQHNLLYPPVLAKVLRGSEKLGRRH